jgi:hypothetical protein
MARGKGRGGPRQPAKPAAVSNPGSGRRTDGGAGSKTQPLRVAPGQPYGARKEMTEAQSAAPMAAGGGAVPTATPIAPGASAPPPLPANGVFGPSSTPNIPIQSHGPQQEPLNADIILRILYSKRPTPWIARLLDGGR